MNEESIILTRQSRVESKFRKGTVIPKYLSQKPQRKIMHFISFPSRMTSLTFCSPVFLTRLLSFCCCFCFLTIEEREKGQKELQWEAGSPLEIRSQQKMKPHTMNNRSCSLHIKLWSVPFRENREIISCRERSFFEWPKKCVKINP